MAVINGITVGLTQAVPVSTYLMEHNYRLDCIAVELSLIHISEPTRH